MSKYDKRIEHLKDNKDIRDDVKKETNGINTRTIPKDFNPIIIRKNSKIPIGKWKPYKTRKYPREKLKNHDGNVAVHCGKISNNLLIMDWDFKEGHKYFFETLYQKFSKKFPELANTYIVKTPHGFHFYYRMVGFLEKRKLNDNGLFTLSKKLKKDVFKGTIKTKYYEHLAGWDILGQEGYALIPPSQLYELEYINNNGVRVRDYEFKVNKEEVKEIVNKTLLKYEAYNNKKIKTINSKQFEKVREFFLLDKTKEPRKPFIDIMNGVIEIETYAIKTGQPEHIYWKYIFREMWHYCGMEPYEVYKFLEMNQPAYKKEVCDTQLQHHPYTDNPLTTEKMKKYFPDYYTQKTTKKKTETIIKNTGITLSDLVPTNNNINDNQNNDITTSEVILSKKNIPFDRYNIIISDSKINKCEFKRNQKGEVYIHSQELILDGKLKIDKKTYDFKTNNTELFSFWFNNHYYSTMSITNSLRLLEPYIYKGNNGKDVIKRVFNVLGKGMKAVDAEYILGFNNGWKLPQLEEDNGYVIIIHTDLQRDNYNRIKNIIKEYSEKKKIKIIKTFQSLIKITQNKKNIVILLAWSLSAPFRLVILDYCDIFPHLFNVGKPTTGKNASERTFITDFYKAYDKMLSPYTLESTSRLEDHLSESTFPHVITEVHKVNNINAGPILKDHATGTSDFERKKDALKMAFKKPKIAPLSLDSNKPIKLFEDPAMNTKIIVNEFKKQINVDPEWKNLNRELRKEKLFSFIYDYTKDWTNKDVFRLLDKQYNKLQKEFGSDKLQKLEKENPRLISIYKILLFGLELLHKIFDVEFEASINIILNPIKLGRQFITMELKDQFFAFCKNSINFEEDYENEYSTEAGNTYFKTIKGNNPKYLTCALISHKDELHYAFTQDNLRDFNEYSRKNYGLKELNDLIMDALGNKEDIQYVNKYIDGNRTRYIQIKRDLF